jgi:hypothetical protein
MSSATMEMVPDAVRQMTQQAMTGEPARSSRGGRGLFRPSLPKGKQGEAGLTSNRPVYPKSAPVP